MRLLLSFIGLLLANTCFAQSDGFWSAMPDSLHHQRYLKNWNLKGPVKQVIVNSVSSIEVRVVPVTAKPEFWDTNTISWLHNKYNNDILLSDTIIFSSKGELKQRAYHYTWWNQNKLDSSYTIEWNTNGRPLKIYSLITNDSILFTYDSIGRLLSLEEPFPFRKFKQKSIWQHTDSTAIISHFNNQIDSIPSHINTLYYNEQGRLIRECIQNLLIEAPLVDDSLLRKYSIATKTFQYDPFGHLVVMRIAAEWYFVRNKSISATDPLIDSMVLYSGVTDSFFYNKKGLVEKRVSVADNPIVFYGEIVPPSKYDNFVIKYKYDENGWLVKQETFRGLDFKAESMKLTAINEFIYKFDVYGNPIEILHKDVGGDFNLFGRNAAYQLDIIHYDYYK